MAWERWYFNRGCVGAPRRWPYVLLLALYVLGSSLADERDRYHYALDETRGKTSIDHGIIEFSGIEAQELARQRRDVSDKTTISSEKGSHELPQQQKSPQSQPDPAKQPQQQGQQQQEKSEVQIHPQSPQPNQQFQYQPQSQPQSSPQPQQQQQSQAQPQPQSQPQPQQQSQPQPQPSPNASNASSNVSYSTDDGTKEVHDQPANAMSSSTTNAPVSGKPEVAKPKKNPVVVSQPMNPSTGEPVSPTVWANRTMWSNVTAKATENSNASPKVAEFTPLTESADKDKADDDIGDISISKFADVTNKTLTQHNITKTEFDTHQYYNSTFIIAESVGKKYWVDMDNHPDVKVNELLSQSHRCAATVKLKFDFPFYGHKVRNITIATGGFLYTGEYVHSWLAATQYIAPLMANFDTRLSNESYVKYADNGTAFTVEWEKVVLQDKPKAGAFTFQVTLHQNGDIVFVYSVIPLMVERIEDTAHPVKVGLSDAYIMDRIVFFVRRKTIYEYHRVNFNRQDIKNWTVIYLHALPTCLEMDNCKDCLTKLKDFECKWCSELNQCSTGTFRSRQDWLLKGCDVRKIKEVDNCPSPTTTYQEHEEEYNREAQAHSEEIDNPTVHEMSRIKEERISRGSLEKTRDNVSMGVSGIIGILLIIGLVVGLAGWGAYAYRNPHSASGQMLIRYRPSQWSWRRGEARYTAATIHM